MGKLATADILMTRSPIGRGSRHRPIAAGAVVRAENLAPLEADRHDDGMRGMGLPLLTLAAVGVLHPHTRGTGVDYVGVFVASVASWAALPGPGEAALIAAGI